MSGSFQNSPYPRGLTRHSAAPLSRLLWHARLVISSLVLAVLVALPGAASAQTDPSSRLQQLEAGKNRYRGAEAVPDVKKVQENMKDLFEAVIIPNASDGRADKWMSPHLRDIKWSGKPKDEEVYLRRETIPYDYMYDWCMNEWAPPIEAACPFTVPSMIMPGRDVCTWHGEKFSPHRPAASCFQKNTRIYGRFTTDSNWKICCVDPDQVFATTEEIVTKHPDGDGWSGLYEFYYPVTALGWENDRTTTMIADKNKVEACLKESDPLMEDPDKAGKWVAGAIARNLSQAAKAGGETAEIDQEGLASQIHQQVAEVIKDVRPEDKKLRFTDSLQSEGLTVRPNLATLDPVYRTLIAKRFCGRPTQFYKIMNPAEDNVQKGGGVDVASLDNIPVWSNYCPEGVNLMIDPSKSELDNIDGTPTEFKKGMAAWRADPLYCQRMHLTNPNMSITGIDEVINKNPGGMLSQEQVGHTCLDKDKLNGGMVPITLNRHAAVERRTAIADHALGFLIAARLAEGMRDGKRSYLKGYEPQPYTKELPELLRVFEGRPFRGGGTNELERVNPAFSRCETLSGESYQFQNKADRLYISNKTHEPFTQKMIDDKNTIDKYVQGWADDKTEKISERGLDEKSSNYATAFRPMAMCPAGKVRWRPLPDEHNNKLPYNLSITCREEYFGGLP